MNSYYPEFYSRGNYNVSRYVRIAIDHFLRAHQTMSEHFSDPFFFVEEAHEIEESILICEVFSAFAVEAFLNDYISATLLDEENELFDKLSPISKMHLISKALFHETMNQSSDLVCKLQELFKKRNRTVHSYSFDATHLDYMRGMTEEEFRDYEEWIEANKDEWEESMYQRLLGFRNDLLEQVSSGYDCLRTIYLLAELFDEKDQHAKALIRTFDSAIGMDIYTKAEGDYVVDKDSKYYKLMRNLKKKAPNSYKRQYGALYRHKD